MDSLSSIGFHFCDSGQLDRRGAVKKPTVILVISLRLSVPEGEGGEGYYKMGIRSRISLHDLQPSYSRALFDRKEEGAAGSTLCGELRAESQSIPT